MRIISTVLSLLTGLSILLGAGCTTSRFDQDGASQSTSSQADSTDPREESIRLSSLHMEAELAQWSPTAADARVPPEKLRDRRIEIEGEWIGLTGMDSAGMIFRRRPDGDYDVGFVASGCLAIWTLKRTAVYREGILTLDRSVQEYCPITFKTLYAIRVDGRELLLPAPNVDKLLKDLDSSGNSKPRTIGVSFYTYGRRSDGERR